MPELLNEIYLRLLERYGRQNWWPARSAFEMMVGAVLTQNTAWTNVEKAITRLPDGLSPAILLGMGREQLIDAIRPSGFFNQKCERLYTLARWASPYISHDGGCSAVEETPVLRAALLSLNGIGRETADSILLYAFGRPVFVIDAYTRRIFERIGTEVPSDYDGFARVFTGALPEDAALFNEYHALIIALAKRHCRSKNPLCVDCPLNVLCRQRQQAV